MPVGIHNQKQHIGIERKLKLRRLLMERMPQDAADPWLAYVPFIGDGDIAQVLYHPYGYWLHGADTDPERVAVAQSRFPDRRHEIIVADCELWPFASDDDIVKKYRLADFDAYSNPYKAFKAFWENAPKAETMALFFTDGHRETISRRLVYNFETDKYDQVPEINDMRVIYHHWYRRYALKWFREYIKPYRVAHEKKYQRGHMIYWGAVVTMAKRTPVKRTAVSIESDKKKFLEELGEGRTITAAAAIINRGRNTLYCWREDDPDFAHAWDEKRRIGGGVVLDWLHDSAESGNVTAQIYALKLLGLNPDKMEQDPNANIERRVFDFLQATFPPHVVQLTGILWRNAGSITIEMAQTLKAIIEGRMIEGGP